MKYNMFFIGTICSLMFVSCSSEKQEEKKVSSHLQMINLKELNIQRQK